VADPAVEKPKRTRKAKVVSTETAPVAEVEAEAAPTEKPKRTRKANSEPVSELAAETPAPPETAPSTEAAPEPEGTRRGGWWQRTFGATE
jgi:hypothetical protein